MDGIQGPVVQNFVSLTLSLSPQLVIDFKSKYFLLFLLKQCEDSHIFFSNKNNSVFVILPFENFKESLTNDIVNFKQLAPEEDIEGMKSHD